jgi:hypothetical protein
MATVFWDMDEILLIEYLKKRLYNNRRRLQENNKKVVNCHTAKRAPQL